jgi:hypothetical protein
LFGYWLVWFSGNFSPGLTTTNQYTRIWRTTWSGHHLHKYEF